MSKSLCDDDDFFVLLLLVSCQLPLLAAIFWKQN